MRHDGIPDFREIAPGVHCSAELIQTIAEIAVEGYRQMAWGGVERGGLLLGVSRHDSLWLVHARELESEHEFGPAFHLSHRDKDRLKGLIEEAAHAPLSVVGWFRTTSLDLELTDEDTSLADLYFGGPGQITLVVCRGRPKAPRFGVYARNGNAHVLVAEFSIERLSSLPASPPNTELPRGSWGLPDDVSPPADGPTMVPVAFTMHPAQGIKPPLPAAENIPASAPPSIPSGEIDIDAGGFEEFVPAGPSRTGITDWLAFFGLEVHPFSPQPDPAFYVDTAVHREARAVLDYGIDGQKGVILLTGKAGLGKTLLLKSVAGRTRNRQVGVALIADAAIDVAGLYAALVDQLALQPQGWSNVHSFLALQERAIDLSARGSTVAILADNAHLLPVEVLEEFESLSNIESRRGKMIQIVLAGELGLLDVLQSSRLAGLKQRILLRAKLTRLNEDDTETFIQQRLGKAQGPPNLFSRECTNKVHRVAAGVPRLINAICASTLDLAFHGNTRTITTSIIERAAALLDQ